MKHTVHARHALALLFVAIAGIGGPSCRKDGDASSEPSRPPAFNPLEPLRGAPDDWDAFLEWADAQLLITPEPAPLPRSQTLPSPDMGLVRLSDRFPQATVDCDWQAPPDGGGALVSLGPFRSDQPTPQWVVNSTPDGATPPMMTVQGFQVSSEDVGRITLDIKIPWGRHVDLIWSNAGKIRLPLPSHDRSWTLSVTTDGLADWQGPLQQLVLRTDGPGLGPVEVTSIRLFGRENAFPQAVGIDRVNLDRELRTALYAHTPSTVRFDNVVVPPNGKLQTGLGWFTNDKHTSTRNLTHVIRVHHDHQTTEVLRERLERANQWHDVSVSLAAFTGKTVSVSLETTGAGGDLAFWGNPTIYEPVDRPPIVVVYLIDTLAAPHIGLYGYHRDTMPHLGELAEEGVWFSNAFANSPKTVNSVPDILFSMPTERHGVVHASFRAPDELVSLAEVFRARGFATASFCTNVNAGPRQNVDQGFDHFFDRIAYWWTKDADRTVPLNEATSWIEHHDDRPMLLYVHTAEPHGPYAAPEGFAGRFDTGYRGPINGYYDNQNFGFKTARKPEEIAHVASLYDEECAYADHRLDTFLQTLRQSDRYDRVSLVVTSDHGEEFFEHGAWTHGDNLHTEVQRVPLVMLGPHVSGRGPVSAPVQLHDIMPTLLEQFGLPHPYPINGDSLMPFLRATAPGRDGLAKRTLFASNHAYVSGNVIEAAVIERGKWKLLYRFDADRATGARPVRFELYDLESDPTERQDVISDNRPLARTLIGKLIAYRRTQAPFETTIDTDQIELDPEQLRELQSLGYIGRFEEEEKD